jgi:hypothetical protein
MKATIDTSILYPRPDYKSMSAVINEAMARFPRNRKTALEMLAATGMHDPKTGKAKKKFR